MNQGPNYAVKCSDCGYGYVDGALCSSCNGVGKILIPDPRRRWHRVGAWICFITFIGLVGFLVGGMIR
jgi:hypothetical protein